MLVLAGLHAAHAARHRRSARRGLGRRSLRARSARSTPTTGQPPRLTLFVNGGIGNPTARSKPRCRLVNVLPQSRLQGSIDEFKAAAAGDFASDADRARIARVAGGLFAGQGASPDFVNRDARSDLRRRRPTTSSASRKNISAIRRSRSCCRDEQTRADTRRARPRLPQPARRRRTRLRAHRSRLARRSGLHGALRRARRPAISFAKERVRTSYLARVPGANRELSLPRAVLSARVRSVRLLGVRHDREFDDGVGEGRAHSAATRCTSATSTRSAALRFAYDEYVGGLRRGRARWRGRSWTG